MAGLLEERSGSGRLANFAGEVFLEGESEGLVDRRKDLGAPAGVGTGSTLLAGGCLWEGSLSNERDLDLKFLVRTPLGYQDFQAFSKQTEELHISLQLNLSNRRVGISHNQNQTFHNRNHDNVATS
jgi:hypothetical protein